MRLTPDHTSQQSWVQRFRCAAVLRFGALTLALCACAPAGSFAQSTQLVFTTAVPDGTQPETTVQSAVVEERGLALWAGVATDFGVGVTLSSDRWTVRGITSMTVLPVGIHDRPTFQQVDAIRPLFLSRRVSIAGGGGVRALWDGTSVLVGRLLANSDAGGGRLQGSVVTEHAISSLDVHDAADLLTTVGWSRPVGARLSVGIEGIGQDLEGLWDPAERDGGATLMVGPSLHAQSISGRWTASVTAGPVAHKASTAAPPVRAAVASSAARHFGVFASATWTP